MGKWYADAKYFADSAYGNNAFIYSFGEEKQVYIYFEMPDGKRYLINSYPDESSTEAFYQQTLKNPLNSAGSYTSGKLLKGGEERPQTWARIEKDATNKNLYHLLILDKYDIRQALDVSLQSEAVN